MPCPFMYTAKRDSYYSKEPWTLAGTNFALGSYEKFRLAFQDEKRAKILGTSSGTKFEKESNKTKHQTYNFRACYSFSNS